MPRGGRRQVAAEDDDSDSGYGLEPMSPNTKKEHDKKKIMMADLGVATANFIKTSDYSNRTMRSNLPLIRQCDIPNTEEAKVVKENKAQLSDWRNFGQTPEAQETASGDPLIGGMNGNGHRPETRAALNADETRLGRPITLDDTYDDRPRRPGFGKMSNSTGQAPQLKAPPVLPASTSKNVPKKRRGAATQARPWPPPALQDTPAFMKAGGNQSTPKKAGQTAKAVTGNTAVSGQAGLSRPPARKTAIVGQPLVDPSTFMSSVTKLISPGPKVAEPVQAQGSLATSAVVAQAPPSPSSAPTINVNISTDAIRKVPVTEFSFPLSGALAPGHVSTHTDGEPSPAALSGFSPSAESQAAPQVADVDALADALVGLGIEGASVNDPPTVEKQYLTATSPMDTASQSDSLMDSPVPEDIAAHVLVTSKDKSVVVIDGVRYVQEAELLALKGYLEKPDKDVDTGHRMNVSPLVSPATNTLDPSSNQIRAESLLSSSDVAASSMAMPSVKSNPFSPREPVTEEVKVQALANSTSADQLSEPPMQTQSRSLDEALVAAVRAAIPSSGAQTTVQASTIPKTSKTTVTGNTIISKWAVPVEAAEPSGMQPVSRARTDPKPTKTTDVINTIISKWATPIERAKPSVLQPKSSNGTQAHASKAVPTVKPIGIRQGPTPTAAQSATEGIIGDRRIFGRVSTYAANGPIHEEPPPRPAPQRKYHAPGPGYAMLLADLQAAGAVPSSVAKEASADEEL
ncbi:hypothetical protein LTR10_016363 [Elasticomyces elasticus]|uniref:Uncharacterized protein n=1 Tax=Exophiala sideris TaxID=1016849 RepID=A0ABR0J5D6_9EURO|nr:hypothetical protein LTR10_016363 [Elasticomyces elasticus]KAK5028373.1 hypothetical protein LTS07_006464 [Exophiala sideris]KAK5035984.1 hypothetical protein LTR13_005554 [Exophiala sideris]KAK5057020.1 hypothetical protein LTR69_007658 [Exophiala sideris]KAK5181427.1 hypothetical protein LTR44_006222 [Eurotiomycetes sp. CCFEE 6388]